jgi:hypothetical protein
MRKDYLTHRNYFFTPIRPEAVIDEKDRKKTGSARRKGIGIENGSGLERRTGMGIGEKKRKG